MELGLFQKDVLIEKLAKEFYRIQGFVVREDYRMQDATHPHERACVQMAITAIEEVESALADLDDQDEEGEIINWQKIQPLYEGQQYYECKYGNFLMLLLTDGNLTRTEVYLYNRRIYFFEEEVSPEEATRNLQKFLSTLANQLKILSNITFKEESK